MSLEVVNPFIRTFDARAAASWKAMVRAAEARVIEPAFSLEERTGEYVFKALIPGTNAGDVKVDVDHARLRVRGVADMRFTDGGSFAYVRQEKVDEVFTLPPDALGEAATSSHRHYVTTVRIPRRPAA